MEYKSSNTCSNALGFLEEEEKVRREALGKVSNSEGEWIVAEWKGVVASNW